MIRILLAAIVLSFVLAPMPARAQEPGAAGVRLEVPYLPQTEALCGGAAAAMIFRYWGDRHADMEPFAALVDRSAGGIADSDLIAAILERGWNAERIHGATLRAELEAGRPPMVLIEDRPRRFHYVVVAGIEADAVLVHDPTWGPSRRLPASVFERAWASSGHWTLRITPGQTPAEPGSAIADTIDPRPLTRCDQLLDDALTDIEAQGMSRAPALLERVRAECPADAGPLRELAAVRFSERQFAGSARLAEEALVLAPDDEYAADVLASSRFMLNDSAGALRAWNRIGRPRFDAARISGLERTRYSLVAGALGLTASGVLTEERFLLARRRLELLPDQSASRLSLRPGQDGFAGVDVAIVERPRLPRSPVLWSAAAAQSLVEREIALTMPGGTGQGEVWSAAWGWWKNRPRVAVEFAAPRTRWPGSVWRVRGAWEAQTYGGEFTPPLREERTQAQFTAANWLSPNVRAELTLGADAWTRTAGRVDRTVRIGGALERRMLRDRASVLVAASQYAGLQSPGFAAASATASIRSRRESEGFVVLGRVGTAVATRDAPLALWSGAGEGRARSPLLRAHRLIDDGRIEGPVFGRRVAHLTVEAQKWRAQLLPVQVGAALFADSAVAGARPAFATSGSPFQFDVGAGLRMKVPGRDGVFRLDYARGLRDGAQAFIAAWSIE